MAQATVTYSDEELDSLADKLWPRIKAKMAPDQPDETINTKQFIKLLPVSKGTQWVSTYIYSRPDFQQCGYSLHMGSGHHVKIIRSRAVKWIKEHQDEINWNKPLPQV